MNMPHNEPVVINRDVDAILIPMGELITIPEQSVVFITQALGGNYTVNINGNLVQIGAKDADALGFEVRKKESSGEDSLNADGTLKEELVWEELRTCYDPEIPHNIVDLGLVYDCRIQPLAGGGQRVEILMTLTAPGCGMGEFLAADVRNKVASIPYVMEVNVDLTFDPPWNPDMMTEAIRLELGMY